MSDLMQTPDAPTEGIKFQPVSARIRERIYRAKQRFHANDNIAAFLEPGDRTTPTRKSWLPMPRSWHRKPRNCAESATISKPMKHRTTMRH